MTAPKKSPYVLRAEARRIVSFPDEWPSEFSPIDFIYLMAGGKGYSVENQNHLTFCSDTIAGDIESGLLAVRNDPQSPVPIRMAIHLGASEETKALAEFRIDDHPMFGECEGYTHYEKKPALPFITRESAQAWLSSRQMEPSEYIAEWLRVGGIILGESMPNQIAAPEVTPDDGDGQGESATTAFRPHVAWQVALFDAWPAICQGHGRAPSPAEAVRWIKRNDKSGTILDQGTNVEMWWQPQRGKPKKVTLGAVENVISAWRVKGVIPA